MIETLSLREAKARRWRELIAEQTRSGLSVTAFCEIRQLKLSTFRYWKDKTDSTTQASLTSRFISVSRQEFRSTAPRILLPNGVAIDLNASLDAPIVSGFLKSLCGVNGGPHAKP